MLVHKLHVVHKPRVTSLTFTLTSFTSCAGVQVSSLIAVNSAQYEYHASIFLLVDK